MNSGNEKLRIPPLAVGKVWPARARMKYLLLTALCVLCAASSVEGQPARSAPDTVLITSGPFKLKGLLWKPRGPGPFPGVLFNHGSGPTNPARAEVIGPVFASRGYVLLFLFRRGDGLSSDQGQSLRDLMDRETAARGEAAAEKLQAGRLTQEHLDDVLAGLTFIKSLSVVDSRRLAIAGHSFGGQLSLLAAERDTAIRAVATFGVAARRWGGSPALQNQLVAAARNIAAPLFLTHAANDYSTTPARVMAAERGRVHKPYELKIYPPVGATPVEGHAAVYSDIATWEADLFRFLDRYTRPARQ